MSYNLKTGRGLEYQSGTQLQAKKKELERVLITKELSTREMKKVQDQIHQISRALVNAREDHQVELEEGKARDLIKIEQ